MKIPRSTKFIMFELDANPKPGFGIVGLRARGIRDRQRRFTLSKKEAYELCRALRVWAHEIERHY